MRWAPRRHPDRPGRGRLTATLLATVLAAGCTNAVTGQSIAVEIGPLTAKEAVDQSLKADLAEAAALRFTGSFTSSDQAAMTVSVTAMATGEVFGTITLDGLPATVLVIDKVSYLMAATEFWTVNAPKLGILATDASALAARWVEVPTDLIKVSFGDILTPVEIVRSAGKVTRGDQLLDAPTGSVGGVDAVGVPTEQGTVTLAAEAPHGVLKIDLRSLGKPGASGNGVTGVSLEVKDVSAQAGQFYADLAKQAKAELGVAIDGLTTVLQTGNRFEPCGDANCTLAVDFTNESKLAVRVHLRAAWNGDNQPLGIHLQRQDRVFAQIDQRHACQHFGADLFGNLDRRRCLEVAAEAVGKILLADQPEFGHHRIEGVSGCSRCAQGALGRMRGQHLLVLEKGKECLDPLGTGRSVHELHPCRICAASVPKSTSQPIVPAAGGSAAAAVAGLRERRQNAVGLTGDFSMMNPASPAMPDPSRRTTTSTV